MSEKEHARGHAAPEPSRPHMPGYGIHADSDGMLPWSHLNERMSEARNYWIGTTRPDGRPHAVPVWGVWLGDALAFGTGPRSRKARNLAVDPRMVAHLESGDDVIILEGIAERADPGLLAAAEEAYQEKYDMDLEEAGGGNWYVLRPKTAYAWLERDFPKSATRWCFEEE